MQRIEISRKHCELMGDLFINDLLDPKKIEHSILPEMKRCLGEDNATISISFALQKCGCEGGLVAGTIASYITGGKPALAVLKKEEEEK